MSNSTVLLDHFTDVYVVYLSYCQGCAGVGEKGVGADLSTPKGPGADDSISEVSLPGGVCSLG